MPWAQCEAAVGTIEAESKNMVAFNVVFYMALHLESFLTVLTRPGPARVKLNVEVNVGLNHFLQSWNKRCNPLHNLYLFRQKFWLDILIWTTMLWHNIEMSPVLEFLIPIALAVHLAWKSLMKLTRWKQQKDLWKTTPKEALNKRLAWTDPWELWFCQKFSGP